MRIFSNGLAVLRYAVVWKMRPDVPGGAMPFSYYRNVRPLMWALIAASLVELAVVHVLVAVFWSLKAAWLLFAVSGFGLLYLVGLVNSLDKLPLLVGNGGVRIRAGLLIDHWLPIDQVADATHVLNCGNPKRDGFLKASLVAYPNTIIELSQPLVTNHLFRGPRSIVTVGVRPDDPSAFVAAVNQAIEARR